MVSEAGALSGCSITASCKCKPHWWKGLFGAAPTDYEERDRCEEREMALEAAKEACIILLENTDFDVWIAGSDKLSSIPSVAMNNQQSFKSDPSVTNYRGSDLLDSSSKDNNNA
ncbi:hypothetical protein PVAP13_8KG352400 [Panicum virgatum]|uniref:Uncharacterized protein n=1 Tax=Panicum virgatum TaxID=38727 RepID=A0A8T0PM44_PANVG|nr:hypothetical protein PVAP13_8KG352400 [Panicum virgatum]